MRKLPSALLCLLLAAGLAGCTAAAPPASFQTQGAAPAYDSAALDDGALRLLYGPGGPGGGALLRGGEVLYRAAPSETLALLTDAATGQTAGWLLSTNGEDGARRTEVYDTEGRLLFARADSRSWSASLSDGLLALTSYSEGESLGCVLADLRTGAETPLPEGTVGCILTEGGCRLLTLRAEAPSEHSPGRTVLLQDAGGAELARFEDAYAYQAYSSYDTDNNFVIEQWSAGSGDEQWSTTLFIPATGELVAGYEGFCGPDAFCCRDGAGGYLIRTLSGRELGRTAAACAFWRDGWAMTNREDGTYGWQLTRPDGSVSNLAGYDIQGEHAAFLTEEGELLLLGPEGEPHSFRPDSRGAARMSVNDAHDGCALVEYLDEDYSLISWQLWGPDGLRYDSVSGGPGYNYLYYLTGGEGGPLYAASRRGIGGSWLYDVVDSSGQAVLEGLAEASSGELYGLPDGCFCAKLGFAYGFMDSSGRWLYCESVFDSFSGEDSFYW